MGLALFVVSVGSVCAVVWYALAVWLKVQLPRRGCLATGLPVIASAVLLWAFGGALWAVGALFLLPLATALCAALVLLLENLTAHRIG